MPLTIPSLKGNRTYYQFDADPSPLGYVGQTLRKDGFGMMLLDISGINIPGGNLVRASGEGVIQLQAWRYADTIAASGADSHNLNRGRRTGPRLDYHGFRPITGTTGSGSGTRVTPDYRIDAYPGQFQTRLETYTGRRDDFTSWIRGRYWFSHWRPIGFQSVVRGAQGGSGWDPGEVTQANVEAIDYGYGFANYGSSREGAPVSGPAYVRVDWANQTLTLTIDMNANAAVNPGPNVGVRRQGWSRLPTTPEIHGVFGYGARGAANKYPHLGGRQSNGATPVRLLETYNPFTGSASYIYEPSPRAGYAHRYTITYTDVRHKWNQFRNGRLSATRNEQVLLGSRNGKIIPGLSRLNQQPLNEIFVFFDQGTTPFWTELGAVEIPHWTELGAVGFESWREIGGVDFPAGRAAWTELGYVQIAADVAEGPPPYPIDIPGDIPAGDPCPAPPLEIPAAAPGLSYSVWLETARDENDLPFFTDITGLVRAASWKHGGIAANRLGGVEEAASGEIALNNELGHWNVFNPSPSVETAPGAEIEIRAGQARTGELLFKGWTRGVQNIETPDAPAQTLLKIYSTLTRLAEFGEGLFANAVGFRPLGEHANLILNTLGVRGQGIGRDLEDGLDVLSVSGSNLNSSGLLSSGPRKRAAALGVFNALCQLEGGRAYDNRRGQFVMTAFRGYGDGRHRAVRRLGEVDPSLFYSLDPGETVVNLIELDERDPYKSDGHQRLDVDAAGEELAFSRVIPARSIGVVEFNLESRAHWRTSLGWTPPVSGTHYRTPPGIDYLRERFYADDETMRWYFRNNESEDAAVEILKAELTPGVLSISQRRWIEPARNAASIRRYGRHAVQFPIQLAERSAGPTLRELERRMATWAIQYSGMDGERADPWLACQVVLPDYDISDGAIDIDDVVVLTVERDGVCQFRNKGFFVRGVQIEVDSELKFDVRLTLLDTRGVSGTE